MRATEKKRKVIKMEWLVADVRTEISFTAFGDVGSVRLHVLKTETKLPSRQEDLKIVKNI